MSQVALKLVAIEPPDRDVLRFERRDARRRVLSGRVTSLQKPTDLTLSNNRISSVQLRDISDTGVGGIVQEPVERGTSIVIFFPPHGAEPGFDRYGHVVRCASCEHGYEVGIRFITKSAA